MTKRTATLFSDQISAHAVMLGADAAAEPVDGAGGRWIMLLPTGSFSGRDGRGPYTTDNMAGMRLVIEATAQRAGSTDLVVDYDHQSQFSAVPGVGGQAPAAGWIKRFEARPDGLYGLINWTDRAAQSIRAGEYRYISPVYQHDKAGKVLRLISAGLTNTPNLDLAAVAASAQPNQQEPDMKNIAAALGLPEDADENAILTAINKALTSTASIATAAGLAGTAKPEEIVTAINSARAGVDPAKFVPIEQVMALQTAVKVLQDKMEGDDAETAVNTAIKDGKLAPALKSWGLDYHKKDAAGFQSFVDGSPVLTAVQRTTTTTGKTTDDDLTAEDLAVMNQMGLTREAFLKAKKAGDA
jgi:phage I-like protein